MAYNPGTLTVFPWPMGGSVMRKLEIIDPEIMGIAIRQEIERNDESRYDHRLHGLLLVANGMSARQAALWLSESERTVQRWVNRFEQIGFAGLQEGERPGRPRRLSEEDAQRVEHDLRRTPADFVLAQTLCDGKLLAEYLRGR